MISRWEHDSESERSIIIVGFHPCPRASAALALVGWVEPTIVALALIYPCNFSKPADFDFPKAKPNGRQEKPGNRIGGRPRDFIGFR